MHLVIGAIMAGLIGHKGEKGKKPSLLGLRGPIETRHQIPGRVRFAVSVLRGRADLVERVEGQVGRLEGVREITASPVTGSVVVRFDPAAGLSAEILFAALVRLLGLEEQIRKRPEPVIPRELNDMGDALNQAVYDGTQGMVDLWSAVPLLLIALAVKRLATERTVGYPSAFTLLWWAYSLLFQRRR